MEKIGAEVNVKVTYSDYLQFPDDGKRYEVIDGDVSVTPGPNTEHQDVLGRLFVVLTLHMRRTKAGKVLIAPCDVVFDQATVVQPDLLYVSQGRRAIVQKAKIAGAPDLVVEILSPSTAVSDRSLKLKTYEKHSVAHYWILDPATRGLEEYVLVEGKYRLVSKLAGPVPFEPRVLPGLTIALGEVWADDVE